MHQELEAHHFAEVTIHAESKQQQETMLTIHKEILDTMDEAYS